VPEFVGRDEGDSGAHSHARGGSELIYKQRDANKGRAGGFNQVSSGKGLA
jgi:hypothetical protein